MYNSIPGRYVNRIGHGKYRIDNQTYETELNDGTNTLHSGTNNWSYRTWNVTSATNESITFSIRDEPNSSKGMPGLVLANVTYSVSGNKWSIKMNAVSPTVKSRTSTSLSNLPPIVELLTDYVLQLSCSRSTENQLPNS